MPVLGSKTPTVSVSVPVPTPVQSQPKRPAVQFAPDDTPQQPVGPSGIPPVQPPRPMMSSLILPWSPPPKGASSAKTQMRRLPRRVVRFSATPTDLAGLLRAARENPYEPTHHAVIADALDEAYPGNHVSGLIRRQYGFGEHGGEGEHDNRWFDSVGDRPGSRWTADLGNDGPFRIRLRHAGGEDRTTGATYPTTMLRWMVHATSTLSGSGGLTYTFEFPHESAHEIPKMFPAAKEHIDSRTPDQLKPRHRNPEVHAAYRDEEARRFDERMNAEERRRP